MWTFIIIPWITLSQCKPDFSQIQSMIQETQIPAEIGVHVEIQFTSAGKVKTIIQAETMRRVGGENPYMEFMDGLEMTFYNDAGEVQSTLNSRYGMIPDSREKMEVREAVKIVTARDEKLETEELWWNRQEKKLFSDKFVKITTPDEIIQGTGLEAAEDMSSYTIKQISGIIQLKSSAQP